MSPGRMKCTARKRRNMREMHFVGDEDPGFTWTGVGFLALGY